VGQPGIAAMEVSMLKTVDRVACWIELDCVALGMSFPKLDSSMRNWDDFFILGCKCWSTYHYSVWRKLH
jgi:hypothetical protein